MYNKTIIDKHDIAILYLKNQNKIHGNYSAYELHKLLIFGFKNFQLNSKQVSIPREKSRGPPLILEKYNP